MNRNMDGWKYLNGKYSYISDYHSWWNLVDNIQDEINAKRPAMIRIFDGEIERQIPLFLLMEMTLHQTYGMEKLHELIKLLSIKKRAIYGSFLFLQNFFSAQIFLQNFWHTNRCISVLIIFYNRYQNSPTSKSCRIIGVDQFDTSIISSNARL